MERIKLMCLELTCFTFKIFKLAIEHNKHRIKTFFIIEIKKELVYSEILNYIDHI